MKATDYFTPQQKEAIKAAISRAELMTSGEIRIFIDDHCKENDPMDKALHVFSKLNMHETKLRNGVLIYLSVKDRKFAIIGDKGIHEKVKEDFWSSTKDIMLLQFKENNISQGLIAGIEKAGEVLSTFFPRKHNDTNELPNEPVFGN